LAFRAFCAVARIAQLSDGGGIYALSNILLCYSQVIL
jgi:hypothetical protein